jgi:spore coat polysaccharide biosynthesis protein SpsF
MNKKTVAIVQARMGATRLPGKMMKDLNGYPIIHWVLTRVNNSKLIDQTILATSTNSENDELEDYAKSIGINCFRGSEEDVLKRFSDAAEKFNAETVIRVCADNPFIAPEELDRLIGKYNEFLEQGAEKDKLLVCNNVPENGNNYPDGLGAQIFSAEILHLINAKAEEIMHREHVDEYILDNEEYFDIRTFQAPEEIAYPDLKLDIDTVEDLEKMRKIAEQLSTESCINDIIKTALSY